MPTFDVKPIVPGHGEPMFYQRCASGGPEAAAYAKQLSGDTWGATNGNNGLYGVDLLYEYTLMNSGSSNCPAWAYAQAMNTSAEYHGAAWDVNLGASYQGYIPKILFGATYDLADITESHQYSVSPAPSGNQTVDFLFANGGGATLPFSTYWCKIQATKANGGG